VLTLPLVLQVEVPDPPDYLMAGSTYVDVSNLSRQDLVRIGDAWRDKLVERAEERRKKPAAVVLQTVPPAPAIQTTNIEGSPQ